MEIKENISDTIKSNSFKKIYIILIVIFLIAIITYFIVVYNTSKPEPSLSVSNEFSLSDTHVFDNSANLISEDFSIKLENGLYKINGNIINTSQDALNNLNCIYTLLDNDNNIIYEFDIPISTLKSNIPTSFSYVCAVDLTNVTSYSVKLSQ